MTEPTDDRSDLRTESAEPMGEENRAARRDEDAAGDVARPTPQPRTLAEALDVDPDRDDVKG